MNIFYNPDENRLRAGWRLLLQFVMMVFFLGGLQFAYSHFFGTYGALANSMLSIIAFTLSVWIAARYLDKRAIQSLGLGLDKRWIRELMAGIVIGAVAMCFIFILQLAMGWINFTGYGWERATSLAYPLPLLGYLAAMLLVGFYEELFSRGYQITNLVEGFSGSKISSRTAATGAVLLSSTLFGALHIGNANASVSSTFNIIVAGVVLALPYLVTGSLALSVGLHAAWNFFQGGIFGLPVSGNPVRSSLLQVRETGPDLFTGGPFGPEAGLTGIMGMILIVLLVYLYTQRAGYPFELHNRFK